MKSFGKKFFTYNNLHKRDYNFVFFFHFYLYFDNILEIAPNQN